MQPDAKTQVAACFGSFLLHRFNLFRDESRRLAPCQVHVHLPGGEFHSSLGRTAEVKRRGREVQRGGKKILFFPPGIFFFFWLWGFPKRGFSKRHKIIFFFLKLPLREKKNH